MPVILMRTLPPASRVILCLVSFNLHGCDASELTDSGILQTLTCASFTWCDAVTATVTHCCPPPESQEDRSLVRTRRAGSPQK